MKWQTDQNFDSNQTLADVRGKQRRASPHLRREDSRLDGREQSPQRGPGGKHRPSSVHRQDQRDRRVPGYQVMATPKNPNFLLFHRGPRC